jgi:hypothetical protein
MMIMTVYGDGVTDDTTAIQAFLDGRAELYFPDGTEFTGLLQSKRSFLIKKTLDVSILATEEREGGNMKDLAAMKSKLKYERAMETKYGDTANCTEKCVLCLTAKTHKDCPENCIYLES